MTFPFLVLFCYYLPFSLLVDRMSTICCLTGPSNPSFISASLSSDANEQQESQRKEKANYNIVFNRHVPPMTHSHNMPLSSRSSHYNQQQQQQHHPLLYVSEEVEIPDLDNLHDNDKLLLPRSTRVLKRRTSLFEKSRDWVMSLSAQELCFSFDCSILRLVV